MPLEFNLAPIAVALHANQSMCCPHLSSRPGKHGIDLSVKAGHADASSALIPARMYAVTSGAGSKVPVPRSPAAFALKNTRR